MVLKKREVHFSLIISSLSCVSKLNLQYTASLSVVFSLKVKKQVSLLIQEGFSIVHKFLTAHWYLCGSAKTKKSRNQYVLLMKDFDE